MSHQTLFDLSPQLDRRVALRASSHCGLSALNIHVLSIAFLFSALELSSMFPFVCYSRPFAYVKHTSRAYVMEN